jgi:hypothetical protein
LIKGGLTGRIEAVTSTTGTGQVLNSSPIVERIMTGQNNQALHANQNAAAQQAKKDVKNKETVHRSDQDEKVTIQNNAEREKQEKRQAKNDEETPAEEREEEKGLEDEPPKVKHIDVRA